MDLLDLRNKRYILPGRVYRANRFGYILITLFLVLLTPLPSTAYEYKVAMHVHTNQWADDGLQSLDEVVQAYANKDYDAVVVTPHGHKCPSVPESINGITIIPGYEETTGGGWHVTHFGDMTVLNHPVASILKGADILKIPTTDFVEVFNGKVGPSIQFTGGRMAIVGDDLHDIRDKEFASTALLVSANYSSDDDLLRAIKEGDYQIWHA